MGNFREGFCFTLKRPVTNTDMEDWILCADDLETKSDWMKQIATIRANDARTII